MPRGGPPAAHDCLGGGCEAARDCGSCPARPELPGKRAQWNGVPQRGQEATGSCVAKDEGIELHQLSPCRWEQLVWLPSSMEAHIGCIGGGGPGEAVLHAVSDRPLQNAP